MSRSPRRLWHRLPDALKQPIVLEFTREGPKVYDNLPGVLTNAPTFDWHLINALRNVTAVSNIKPPTVLAQKSALLARQGALSAQSNFIYQVVDVGGIDPLRQS
jgi:choloylglycine hydrolase